MKTSIVKLAHLRSPSCVAGILILADLDAKTIRGAGLHRRCVVAGRAESIMLCEEPVSCKRNHLPPRIWFVQCACYIGGCTAVKVPLAKS